eukprot:9914202-Alexandrium_andersonii.AAC.1
MAIGNMERLDTVLNEISKMRQLIAKTNQLEGGGAEVVALGQWKVGGCRKEQRECKCGTVSVLRASPPEECFELASGPLRVLSDSGVVLCSAAQCDVTQGFERSKAAHNA